MEIQERIDEAFIKLIEKNYAYMLFEQILRTKWRHITLEQGGLI